MLFTYAANLFFYPCFHGKTLKFKFNTFFSLQLSVLFVNIRFSMNNWWAQVDSNHRPPAYQAGALTSWAISPCVRCDSISITRAFLFEMLGGDDGIRTHDPLLAGQVLSQLSYTPIGVFIFHRELFWSSRCVGIDLFSRAVARKVFSARQSLTSVFGMGTGGPFALKTPTIYFQNPLILKIEQRHFLESVKLNISQIRFTLF